MLYEPQGQVGMVLNLFTNRDAGIVLLRAIVRELRPSPDRTGTSSDLRTPAGDPQ